MLANIGLEVVLEMLFLTLSKADIWFVERELVWRTYTAADTLTTTKRVEIINKKKFVTVILNTDDKTSVMYVATLAEPMTILIYPSC